MKIKNNKNKSEIIKNIHIKHASSGASEALKYRAVAESRLKTIKKLQEENKLLYEVMQLSQAYVAMLINESHGKHVEISKSALVEMSKRARVKMRIDIENDLYIIDVEMN